MKKIFFFILASIFTSSCSSLFKPFENAIVSNAARGLLQVLLTENTLYLTANSYLFFKEKNRWPENIGEIDSIAKNYNYNNEVSENKKFELASLELNSDTSNNLIMDFVYYPKMDTSGSFSFLDLRGALKIHPPAKEPDTLIYEPDFHGVISYKNDEGSVDTFIVGTYYNSNFGKNFQVNENEFENWYLVKIPIDTLSIK